MDSSVRKKIRIVLIAFVIVLVPFGYFIKNMIAIHIHDIAMQYVYIEPHFGKGANEVKLRAISEIDRAIKLYKRNYLFYENKAMLYFELKDYERALKEIKIATKLNNDYVDGIVLQGVLNECISNKNEALKLYEIALNKYQKKFEEDTNDLMLNSSILILKYIIDHDKSKVLNELEMLIDKSDGIKISLLERFESFVNYCPEQTLGMKNFLYPNRIKVVFENFTEKDSVENLLIKNNIFWDSQVYDKTNNSWIEFEVKEFYATKALELGFKIKSIQ